jgi:hypothetical protein
VSGVTVSSSGQFTGPNGSNQNPPYSFSNELNTGMRKGTTGNIVLVSSGTDIVEFRNNRTRFQVQDIDAASVPIGINVNNVICRLSSRRELKDSISSIHNCLDIVRKTNPVEFIWKAETPGNEEREKGSFSQKHKGKKYGLIAEEIAEIDSSLAIWGPPTWSANSEEEAELMVEDSDKWVPVMWDSYAVSSVLLGAVKELSYKIDKIEKFLGEINE